MVDLKDVNDDSILVFEYFTSAGVEDLSIVSEAVELIRSLVSDIKDEDIYVLLAKQFKDIFDDFDFDVKTIIIDEKLEDWLEREAYVFDRAMFIAAEGDMNLYNLTKLLELKDIKVYGSDHYAVNLTSDKFETFDYLKNRVKQPMTYNILINPKTYWKSAIQIFFDRINGDYGDGIDDGTVPIMQKPKDIPVLDNSDRDKVKKNKLIAKPRFGVDCDDLKVISSKLDIDELENIYPTGSRFIVQEYIPGDVCSVSLLCDGKEALLISLNKQIVEIDENGGEYLGGYVPYDHPLKDKAFELAKRACEFIPGLKGFVGVDLILADDVYLIEINSRFTTSYVGLQKVSNINIGQTIIDLIDKKISIGDIGEIEFSDKASFSKDENGMLNIKIGE
ncbi:ATP-grasp domain-containing protein [uncultured Methanobrevibacter sp.]|uniref:ATP-grasp domain-containing protein n=1 Tax=uncultured Methanobrevibacter sp. TaxID=253161 RepID=UPI0025EAE730|nr:ATP-grasp domain-containing protein [uncultured Methanobrevibacter sp.]